MAYCPLAQGRAASNETLIAIGSKHDASAAQVALKWLLDQDDVAAIPKASRAESQQANLDALKVKLDDRGPKGDRGAAEGPALCQPRICPGVGLNNRPMPNIDRRLAENHRPAHHPS